LGGSRRGEERGLGLALDAVLGPFVQDHSKGLEHGFEGHVARLLTQDKFDCKGLELPKDWV
jgi:hypothetical protein